MGYDGIGEKAGEFIKAVQKVRKSTCHRVDEMTTAWALALIPIMLLFITSIMVRSHCGTWLQPGAYFSLVVMLYFSLPLIFAPNYYVWPGAMSWILVSVLAFLSGSMLLTYKHNSKSINDNYAGDPNLSIDSDKAKGDALGIHYFPGIRVVLIFSIILGTLSPILLLLFYGKSVGVFLSLKGIADVGSEFSALRYSGQYNPNLIIQVLLAFAYVSPILGGILMALKENKKQLALSLLSFLPSLLLFLTLGARAGLVISFALFISGYFACQVLVGRSSTYRLFSKNRLPVFLALILILLIVFSFGDIARKGQIPDVTAMSETAISARANVYMFGYVPAFSGWFQRAWAENEGPTFGVYTFGGIYELLGLRKVESNPRETIDISTGRSTNIYTTFRDFADDFSFAGSLLFLFIFGLIAGITYFKVGNGSFVLMPLLIAVYAFMSWQLTTIFKYRSIIIAFLVVQAYVIAIRIYQRRMQRQYES